MVGCCLAAAEYQTPHIKFATAAEPQLNNQFPGA